MRSSAIQLLRPRARRPERRIRTLHDPLRWVTAGRAALYAPVALYALLVLPFVFHGVVGEPDLERTAMALVYGASSGLNEAAGFHYGYSVSFGYYQGFYHLLTQSALLTPAAVITAINVVGFVSAVAAMLFLALYMARLFGNLAAFAVCAVFGFSPVFLDLGTSGHPQLPALALLLAGAWLLTFVTEEERSGALRISLGVLAFAIFTAALTIRADEAMAFPFITLLGPRRPWLKASAMRAGVLVAASVGFVALSAASYHDSNAVSEGGGFVANFLATFYKPQTVPRGLFVFLLCAGVVSVATAVALSFTRAARGLDRVTGWAIGLLAVPTLIFWLPNATPGRHMLFAYLAIAILIAVLLVRAVRPAQVIAIALLLPIANQIVAEATHGVLERHYQWMYPLTVWRRATDSVPIGAFPLDHRAKQEAFTQLADEGRAFAQACTGHVLVMSEDPHFMMMDMMELDRSVRLTSFHEAGTRIVRASGTRCTADFVEKQAPSRRDTLREFLEVSRYDGWPIYFQESRRNPYDRTEVPAERRFAQWTYAGADAQWTHAGAK